MAGVRSRTCDHMRTLVGNGDEGSVTASAVFLIIAAALLLIVIASGSRIFLAVSQAHTAADAGALAGAQALRAGKLSACGPARKQVRANSAETKSCKVDKEDVTVKASVKTGVPLLATVTEAARAGPVDCD